METLKETVLEISKDYPVSKDRLYRAWTEAEELKQWWKPMGGILSDVNLDLRKNGKLEYRFSGQHLTGPVVIDGEFLEVAENDKLVYTWNWNIPDHIFHNGRYKLTVTFSDKGSNCNLHVAQENFADEESVYPHRQGWNKALYDLFQYLSQNDKDQVTGDNII